MNANIFLDLDGTLTDPGVGFQNSINYALKKMGLSFSGDILSFIGPPLQVTLATILNTKDKALIAQATEFYREHYAKTGIFENLVYPEIYATLQELVKNGKLLFLATSKPLDFAQQILKHFDLDKYFKGIYGSRMNGELTNKGELIAYVLDQENLLANQCIMVGDREHDIIGAKKNGLRSVGVLWGYGSEEELRKSGADFIAKNPHQLLEIVS